MFGFCEFFLKIMCTVQEAGEYVPESAGAFRRQFPWSGAAGGCARPGVGMQNWTEV